MFDVSPTRQQVRSFVYASKADTLQSLPNAVIIAAEALELRATSPMAASNLPDLLRTTQYADARASTTTTISSITDNIASSGVAAEGVSERPSQRVQFFTADNESTAESKQQSVDSSPIWLSHVRARLLEQLSVMLLTGSDADIAELIGNAVHWEQLLVLLNHQPNMTVRQAAVKALCASLLRADDVYRSEVQRLVVYQWKTF